MISLYITVPGYVSLSYIFDVTWALISWTLPDYIPKEYYITHYEIGYGIVQSENCFFSENDIIRFNRTLNESNTTSSSNISDLIGNSCYLFGVRGYTVNGYGLWTVITNKTLPEPPTS